MAGPVLRVSVTHAGANVVVTLDGELDVATAEQFDAALRAVEQAEPTPRRIVVDADQLTFVDAAGLGPLLDAHRRLPRGTLRLRNVRPPVLRVLRLLDLGDAFGLGG